MRRTNALLLATVLFVVPGCGGSGRKPAEPERRVPSPAGAWLIDRMATKKALEAELPSLIKDPAALAAALDNARALADRVKAELELGSDGTFVFDLRESRAGAPGVSTGSKSWKGRWSSNDSAVTLTVLEEEGRKRNPPDVHTARYDGAQIHLQLEVGVAILFVRR